ncbi:MAG: hypothetical protein ACRDTP_12400 [Mycobacteriales bacterium]
MSLIEQAKGTIKDKVGKVAHDDDLRAEGQAQQDKGEADTKATSEKAKAQAGEKKADAIGEQADRL